jgi:Putative zinc-finger
MQDKDSWNDCPAGVVSDMAARLQLRKRQSQRRPIIGVGIALMVFIGVGFGLVDWENANLRAGLNCRETIPLLAAYHARSLDADVKKDVDEHLSHCPSCQKKYEELHPNEVRNPLTPPSRLVALASHGR